MKQQDIYELSFRRPMVVTEEVLFPRDTYPYPRCPRCRRTIDREYMDYCDRCGQKLDWSLLDKVVTVGPDMCGSADREGEELPLKRSKSHD